MTVESTVRRALLWSLPLLLAAAMPAALLPATSAWAQIIQRQQIEYLDVALSIVPAGSPMDAGQAIPDAHRLIVSLTEVGSGRVVDGASVSADVAFLGYSGRHQPFERVELDGQPRYVATFSMPGRTPYRILIHVVVPDRTPTLEAQFRYTHHH